uniref:Hcy-binding domain-containing protein n=1 Tax=Meloidogyne floridensis TaxID=298350 RepID=A0A915NSB1_9BILA
MQFTNLNSSSHSSQISEHPVLVLSGGFGSQLEALGYAVDKSEVWSGGALIDRPDLVRECHQSFINAGADIIETNTYHLCIKKLRECRGYSVEQAEALVKLAVQIARDAISSSGRSVQLVGSVGPYATYLRDGSEYTGDYIKKPDFNEQIIIDYYLSQCRPLIAAGIRTLVFETIPTLKEVECVGKVLDQLGPEVRAWIVSTCQDGKRTRSGDLFSSVVKVANSIQKVVAVGVNCTAPENITELLEEANKTGNRKALVVYPNSGEIWNSVLQQFQGATQIEMIASLIPHWYLLGARIFGGCCRVMPDHIARIGIVCDKLKAKST